MEHESYQPRYDTPPGSGRPIVSAAGEQLLFLTPEEQLGVVMIRNRHFALTTLAEPSLQEDVFIDANQSRRGLPDEQYKKARLDLTEQYHMVIDRVTSSQLHTPADRLRHIELQARYLRYAAHYFLEGILPAAMTSGLDTVEQLPPEFRESAFDTIAKGYFSAQDVIRKLYNGERIFSYPFNPAQIIAMTNYLIRQGKQAEAETFLPRNMPSFAEPVAHTFLHYLQKAQHPPNERTINQHEDIPFTYAKAEYAGYVALVHGAQAVTHALFDKLPLAQKTILEGYADIKSLTDAGDVLSTTYFADFVMTAEAVFGTDADEIQPMKEHIKHIVQQEYDTLPQLVKEKVGMPQDYATNGSNIHTLRYHSPFSAELYEQAKIVHALANRNT